MPDFPTMDAPRAVADAEYGRVIIDEYRPLEPYIPEMDGWVSMPVRFAYSEVDGFYLEIGPYDLGTGAINTLREMIARYDRGIGPTDHRLCTCSMTQTIGDCPRHDGPEGEQ